MIDKDFVRALVRSEIVRQVAGEVVEESKDGNAAFYDALDILDEWAKYGDIASAKKTKLKELLSTKTVPGRWAKDTSKVISQLQDSALEEIAKWNVVISSAAQETLSNRKKRK